MKCSPKATTTLTFDTLKYANRLKAVGVPPAQAEALAEVLADALRASDLATRADIENLRESLRHEIAHAKADIIKWLAGLLIAQAAVAAALVKSL